MKKCEYTEEEHFGRPHIGAETEASVVDEGLHVVRHLNGEQSNAAVIDWLKVQAKTPLQKQVANWVTTEVTAWMLEANPMPLRSAVSTAALQRLMVVIMDSALGAIGVPGRQYHLLHGGALRAPYSRRDDTSSYKAGLFKSLAYRHGILTRGDSVSAAMGDHLNLSLPGLEGEANHISNRIIQMTARTRLALGAISIALSGASPFFYGNKTHPMLTSASSVRLKRIWPTQHEMDIPALHQGLGEYQDSLRRFIRNRKLKTGGDLWLPVRAQTNYTTQPRVTLEDKFVELGLDFVGDSERARVLLFANKLEAIHHEDVIFEEIDRWRKELLEAFVNQPRTRVEIRTLETPYAFDDQTPYEFLKALYTFLELTFFRLAQNPEWAQGLSYSKSQLSAAQTNEKNAMELGLDAELFWTGGAYHSRFPVRDVVGTILKDIDELAIRTGRREELEIIWEMVNGNRLAPAERIRREAYDFYPGLERNDAGVELPDNRFLEGCLQRNKDALLVELDQIEKDISSLPDQDKNVIWPVLQFAKSLRELARKKRGHKGE